MLHNGLLSRINPDEKSTVACDCYTVGQIMVKANEMFAYQKKIRIQLKTDYQKTSSTTWEKKISNSLFRTSNGGKPRELQSIVDPKTGLTNPDTIFKDYLFTDGKFNSYSKNNESFS